MYRKLGEVDNLESLQRQSWQLELLVTGFALAGMISGAHTFMDWVSDTLKSISGNDLQTTVAGGLLVSASFAYIIILANFFVHVVLRCLWIGAIGSRSVMGPTIIPRRALAPKFASFLRRRTGNFDGYINRLDDAASLVFAFTFMLIIIAVSLLAASIFFVGLGLLVAAAVDRVWVVISLGLTVTVFGIFGLIYLVDFLSGGWLKRFRLFSHLYFPMYRLFGWITFARVYRPLYYNLLNRRIGRILVILLIPYLFICLYLLTLEITPNKFVAEEYLTEAVNSPYTLDPQHYQDSDTEVRASGELVIPSQIIRRSPLQVSIPLLYLYEEYIAHSCPDLTKHYEGSIHSGLFDSGEVGVYQAPDGKTSNKVVLSTSVLACLSSGVELYLDSKVIPLNDLLLTRAPGASYSELVKFISVDTLTPGLHQLMLRQLRVANRRGTDTIRSEVYVPFYYSPD